MKSDKIAHFIYANPYSPSSEILVMALQGTIDQFLDYIFDEVTDSESIRFCHYLAGLEVGQKPEELYEALKSNRENILREFNNLFQKKIGQ